MYLSNPYIISTPISRPLTEPSDCSRVPWDQQPFNNYGYTIGDRIRDAAERNRKNQEEMDRVSRRLEEQRKRFLDMLPVFEPLKL
jgi:hypothetical protein